MSETYLFIDTETTGFPKGGSLIQEGQARVCQIAMILANSQRKILSEFSTLVKPDRWEIGMGAFKCHGITQENCEAYGLSSSLIMGIYTDLREMANVTVAHNEKFDRRMMDIEMVYNGTINYEPSREWFCTMKKNTHITNGKWPKLDATLKYFTGKNLMNAHDAMADVKACMEVFFSMRGKDTT